jgi:hypothetical protein
MDRGLTNGSLRRLGWIKAAFGILAMVWLAPAALAGVPCPSSWDVLSGNWSLNTNWFPATVPNGSSTDVCLVNGVSGTPATTTLDINASVGTLRVGSFNTLNFNPSTVLSVNGPAIFNSGAISIGNAGYLNLTGGTTLSGGGTLTLLNTSYIYDGPNNGLTLENVDNKIQGVGSIGDAYNFVLKNDTAGTINANVNGQILLLNNAGGDINAGTFEATSGGILQLQETVNNAGGTISTDSGNGSAVQLLDGSVIQGGTLNGNIQTLAGHFSPTLDGSSQGAINNQGTVTVVNGSQLEAFGTINNTGTILVNSTGGVSQLDILTGGLKLTGGGTLRIANSANNGAGLIYSGPNNGQILENVNNLILGQGEIGDSYDVVLKNDVGGTINANGNGQALLLDSAGGIVNAGTLEATKGGILQLDQTINNAGATISTDSVKGSVVQLLNNTVIQGGTLNGNIQTVAGNFNPTLDGSTLGTINNQGTITVVDGSQLDAFGTINNTGTILLNGAGGVDQLDLTGDTILKGGGTLTLANPSSNPGNTLIFSGPDNGRTFENVDNLIQGQGHIGDGYVMLLQNDAAGTINANISGRTLVLDSALGVVNYGTLEATNGGILQLDYNINNNPNNTPTGSTISSDATSTVLILNGTTIQGGTLNANIQTAIGNSNATLDGSTQGAIHNQGTITIVDGSQLDVFGTMNNTGKILLNGTGDFTQLNFTADTTLTGGGTITLANSANNGNTLIFSSANNGKTLENVDNLIKGQGEIGDGYDMVLKNDIGGTIDANVSGQKLFIDSFGGTQNAGLLEATGGGVMELNYTINNNPNNTLAGGTISTDATSTVLIVDSTTIQGGTLNGNVGTVAGNTTATLDGLTQGALNNQGTITVVDDSYLQTFGTINNTGTILLNGTGDTTYLNIIGNTTLTGGGTLTLANSANNNSTLIYTSPNNGQILENVDNLIQGQGQIGAGFDLVVKNDLKGTIFANVQGQTLFINATGGLTNAGTLQVAAGSLMHVTSPLTNFSGSTLSGGTYIVAGAVGNPGTLQIDALGSKGGEIVSSGSTIVLNGPTAQITDSANLNALSKFQDNLAAGSFTVENGQQFSTTANGTNFENDGSMNIGAGSSFTTANDYNQGGGQTQVDGTLTASGGQVNINGGILSGTGTINGNVDIGANGTLSPGDAPGTITINGTYTQTGTLNEEIGGTPGSGIFDVTNISGTASLAGILDLSLVNGFLPGNNTAYSYVILDAAGGVTGQFSTVDFLNLGANTFHVDYSNPDEVILDLNGPVVNSGGGGGGGAVPEPAAFLPLIGIVAALVGFKVRSRRSVAAAE